MSNPQESETADLKGGHPPAVKAGGIRIVQHKKAGDKTEEAPMTAEEEAEFGSGTSKVDKHHTTLLVSGALTKGDKDFSPEAVKSYHNKPMPHIDNRPHNSQIRQNINQPKK